MDHRISYYKSINKYLKYYKSNGYENCLKNYKYKNGNPTFKLGTKIATDNIIGEGSYGIVFSGHFLHSHSSSLSSSSSSSSKKSSLAIKISEYTKENKLEAKLNEELTKYVISNRCPHFIIFYAILICNQYGHHPDKQSFNITKYKNATFLSNNEYYITLTELAEGVFYDIATGELRQEIIDNCTIQCLISMIFFNTLTSYCHDDTHLDNFLYSYINPGGYFHYNIYGVDYYLKNLGYLIAINDFGLVTPLNQNNLIKDIMYFAEKLQNYKIINIANHLYYEMTDSAIIKIDLINKQKRVYSLLFELLSKTDEFKEQFFYTNDKKPLNVINKTPYIIR
jgi:hypothetical protein